MMSPGNPNEGSATVFIVDGEPSGSFAHVQFIEHAKVFCEYTTDVTCVTMLARWAVSRGYGIEVVLLDEHFAPMEAS
jgi:hypothetical protein